jgi:hypothetical protein
MSNRPYLAILVAALALLPAAPAAAQGEIIITQAKANAGGVTPGDAAGFPVTLSLPGAYVLGSNLNPPANAIALRVTSHNVDIDMNGFSLNGVGMATFGLYSTFGEGHIHDGIIKRFRFDGISLTGNSNSWVVENLQIVNNGRYGINAAVSNYSRYLGNSILVNGTGPQGGSGIYCGHFCHVEGNTISDNFDNGVITLSGTVLGNSIFSNGDVGVGDYIDAADTGFGNNTIVGNAPNVYNVTPLQPNMCIPTAC